jgi:hypothetical protein
LLSHALLRIDTPQTKAASLILERMAELLEGDKKFRDGHLSRAMGWSSQPSTRGITDVLVAGAAHHMNDNQHPAKAAEALALRIKNAGLSAGMDLKYRKTAIVAAMKKHPNVRFSPDHVIGVLITAPTFDISQMKMTPELRERLQRVQLALKERYAHRD